MTFWTPDRVNTVKAMTESGASLAEIAAQLNTTRSAVGGVLFRLRRGERVGSHRPTKGERHGPIFYLMDYEPAKYPFAPDDSCPDFAWDDEHCAAVLALGGYPVLQRRAA